MLVRVYCPVFSLTGEAAILLISSCQGPSVTILQLNLQRPFPSHHPRVTLSPVALMAIRTRARHRSCVGLAKSDVSVHYSELVKERSVQAHSFLANKELLNAKFIFSSERKMSDARCCRCSRMELLWTACSRFARITQAMI